MKDVKKEGQIRIPSGCAVAAIFNKDGKRISGQSIAKCISVMRERSNGMGGGFAAYGIYPQFKEYFAFHIFYDNLDAKTQCESFLSSHFQLAESSAIEIRKTKGVIDEPLMWRYFVLPTEKKLCSSQLDEREYVVRCVMRINTTIKGAYIFSCGKDMGVFKGVGYPEDIANFFMLESYYGYCFTAHGRYPTNTPGWWGGAHPFALLDNSVVHNGEISSYDANRRTMQMYGYECTLKTDTEVITYIIDYLARRVGLTLRETASVIAAPLWQTINYMDTDKRVRYEFLRKAFSSLLITGPFCIIAGFSGGIMALNDRLKLRSMVVGESGKTVYIASEESAIRAISPQLDKIYSPIGGQAVIVRLQSEESLC